MFLRGYMLKLFLMLALLLQSVVLHVEQGDNHASLSLPPAWRVNADTAHNAAGDGQVRLRLEPLQAPYGDLPDGDEIGAFMQIMAAALHFDRLDAISEVGRFSWGGYSAAVFLGYRPDAIYGRWVGVALDAETVLLIEQTSQGIPSAALLADFDAVLAALRVNDQALPAEPALRALQRLSDPTRLAAAASLRLSSGLEVRLAAPEGWHQRDATQSAGYPSAYFFQDDLRLLAEGENPSGAFVQISLIGAAKLRAILGAEPPPDDPLLAYLNTMVGKAHADAVFGDPISFAWTEEIDAVLLSASYPANFAQQSLVMAVAEEGLVLVTLYVPRSRWNTVKPIWEAMLLSLRVNGEAPPAAPLQEALARESFTP